MTCPHESEQFRRASTRSDVSRRSVAKTDVSRRLWTKAQIRRARQTPLVPVLGAMGYQLEPGKNGNYLLRRLAADIIVKDHYWINREDGSTGNAIDFMVEVENLTFSQAMKHLLASADQPARS